MTSTIGATACDTGLPMRFMASTWTLVAGSYSPAKLVPVLPGLTSTYRVRPPPCFAA